MKSLAVCLALQSKGFLGNDGAETFQTLNCVLKIKGDESNLTVLRKKGKESSAINYMPHVWLVVVSHLYPLLVTHYSKM